MKITITHTAKAININCSKQTLNITKNETTDWTHEKISNFLISIASSTSDDTLLELESKKLESEESEIDVLVFNHICELFKMFADSYNNSLKQSNNF